MQLNINFEVLDHLLKIIGKTPSWFLVWLDKAYTEGNISPCLQDGLDFGITDDWIFLPTGPRHWKGNLPFINGQEHYTFGYVWGLIVRRRFNYRPLRKEFVEYYNLQIPPPWLSLSYGWAISADYVADIDLVSAPINEDRVELAYGPGATRFTYEEIVSSPDSLSFRILDDDGVLYYEGKLLDRSGTSLNRIAEEVLFSPLADYGAPNAGATSIQYQDEEYKNWVEI